MCYRTKNWGGSYPRPLVEGNENFWVSDNHKDIWINFYDTKKRD